MIDWVELLPYVFMSIGFALMVLVARYRSASIVSLLIVFFLYSMYRRDMFTEEQTYPVIAQTAQNIPMDCIESPYIIHIDDNRSTLTSKIKRECR